MRILILWALAALLASCSPARVAAPDPGDTWQAPQGFEDDIPATCDDNRDLFAYDAQAPLDIQETNRRVEDGVTVIDLTFASPMGGRVPATLVIPEGAGPFAGMIYQHGMPSTRDNLIDGAVVYAGMGAVVILIDAPFNRPAHQSSEPIVLTEQDRREQIQIIIDLRRAIDLLISRPEVDPQRLAYVGISYGGAMGGLLAGVEDRLKAYVLQVGDGGLVTHVTGPEDLQEWARMPEEVRRRWLAWMWPIEPIHYVGCAAPAALLFQNGTTDAMVPPADALRYQQAGSEPKKVLWYDAGHGLPVEALRDQAAWLGGQIGISAYHSTPPTPAGLIIAWGVLIASSLGYMLWVFLRARRAQPAALGFQLLWLITTAFLGPLAVAIYAISGRQPRPARYPDDALSPARRALGSAAWAAAGTITGGIVVLWLLLGYGQVLGRFLILQLAVVFLVPLAIGGLIFATARWIARALPELAKAYRRPFLAEMTSTCLVLAGAYPTVNTLILRVFSRWTAPLGFDLLYPPLWGAICLAVLVGGLIAYPFHLWMIRRGVIRWGNTSASNDTKGLAWYFQAALFVLAFAAMLGAIMLSMTVS